jgi:hypothetical protein
MLHASAAVFNVYTSMDLTRYTRRVDFASIKFTWLCILSVKNIQVFIFAEEREGGCECMQCDRADFTRRHRSRS